MGRQEGTQGRRGVRSANEPATQRQPRYGHGGAAGWPRARRLAGDRVPAARRRAGGPTRLGGRRAQSQQL
eukprot:493259-Prymnesium_polylepis.1